VNDEAQDLERQQREADDEYKAVEAEITRLTVRIANLQKEQTKRRVIIADIARRRMNWWER
jgi:peptidoglycan hydrolase CwlO-like protein